MEAQEIVRRCGIQELCLLYTAQSVSVFSGRYQGNLAAFKVLQNDERNLEEECKRMLSLHHEHVVKLYKYWWEQNSGNWYLVMMLEYCDKDLAKDLKQRNSSHYPYTEQELWNIIATCISTLAYLQSLGLAHRDIKPENVFLLQNKIKIGDFGSACQSLADQMSATIVGTPLYLSPQLRSGYLHLQREVVHNAFKSDVYSLGATFLALATLSPPTFLLQASELQIQQTVRSLKYGQYIQDLILWMLTSREEDRPDFQQLQQWITPTTTPQGGQADSYAASSELYTSSAQQGSTAAAQYPSQTAQSYSPQPVPQIASPQASAQSPAASSGFYTFSVQQGSTAAAQYPSQVAQPYYSQPAPQINLAVSRQPSVQTPSARSKPISSKAQSASQQPSQPAPRSDQAPGSSQRLLGQSSSEGPSQQIRPNPASPRVSVQSPAVKREASESARRPYEPALPRLVIEESNLQSEESAELRPLMQLQSQAAFHDDNEPRCLQCHRNIDLSGQKLVQMSCEPEKHLFCSLDCYHMSRSAQPKGHFICPECEMEIEESFLEPYGEPRSWCAWLCSFLPFSRKRKRD